jgi:hypothetical protein
MVTEVNPIIIKINNDMNIRFPKLSKILGRNKYKYRKLYIIFSKKNNPGSSGLFLYFEVYLYLFKFLSNFIHSTAMSADDYLLGLDHRRKNIVFEVGTSQNFIDIVCLTASSLSLEFLKLANEKYSLGINNKLEIIDKEMTVAKNRKVS